MALIDYIQLRKAVYTGPGDTYAASSGQSGGRYMSTSLVSGGLNEVFDEWAVNTGTDYRIVFVYNSHSTSSFELPYLRIVSQLAGGSSIALALDDTSVMEGSIRRFTHPHNATAPMARTSPPLSSSSWVNAVQVGGIDAVIYYHPVYGYEMQSNLSNAPILPPLRARAVWLRRTGLGTVLNDDRATLAVGGWAY